MNPNTDVLPWGSYHVGGHQHQHDVKTRSHRPHTVPGTCPTPPLGRVALTQITVALTCKPTSPQPCGHQSWTRTLQQARCRTCHHHHAVDNTVKLDNLEHKQHDARIPVGLRPPLAPRVRNIISTYAGRSTSRCQPCPPCRLQQPLDPNRA